MKDLPKPDRQDLWAFLSRTHNLTLTDSELDELMREVQKQFTLEQSSAKPGGISD